MIKIERQFPTTIESAHTGFFKLGQHVMSNSQTDLYQEPNLRNSVEEIYIYEPQLKEYMREVCQDMLPQQIEAIIDIPSLTDPNKRPITTAFEKLNQVMKYELEFKKVKMSSKIGECIFNIINTFTKEIGIERSVALFADSIEHCMQLEQQQDSFHSAGAIALSHEDDLRNSNLSSSTMHQLIGQSLAVYLSEYPEVCPEQIKSSYHALHKQTDQLNMICFAFNYGFDQDYTPKHI
jgi:hypothetical protein